MTVPSIQAVGPQDSGLASAHTLQAFIELVYIRVGNEVMSSALASLGEALTNTKQALDVLSNLQSLHNQITVTGQSAIPFNFTNTTLTQTITLPSYTQVTGGLTSTVPATTITVNNANQQSYVSGYNLVAKAYYGINIKPSFSVSYPGPGGATLTSTIVSAGLAGYIYFKNSMLSARAAISALIPQLSAITNTSDNTTLYAKLKIVYNQLPSAGASFSAFKNWVMDSYDVQGSQGVTNQGIIQQNLTNAITAAESLNSDQQEAVRRYMFVFEEYYKSASAILTKVSQIIEKLAQGINR